MAADGLMLSVMHQGSAACRFTGWIRGTVGFLMNSYSEDALVERIRAAEATAVNPLAMTAGTTDGHEHCAVGHQRSQPAGAPARPARLRISVNGRVRTGRNWSATARCCRRPPASTAYNYSANGPILPLGSDVLALTAIAAFRPRRWRGAILPKSATLRFDILEPTSAR